MIHTRKGDGILGRLGPFWLMRCHACVFEEEHERRLALCFVRSMIDALGI